MNSHPVMDTKTDSSIKIEHAETAIAHYLYSNQLNFFNDDRYVGTSKPVCLACKIWFELHPGNFAPQRSHGHAWLRWLPPSPERWSLESDRQSVEIIERMNDTIRAMVEDCIFNNRYGKQRDFSSTTGITVAA